MNRLKSWLIKSMFCDLMSVEGPLVTLFGLIMLLASDNGGLFPNTMGLSTQIIIGYSSLTLGLLTIVLYLLWFHIPGFNWRENGV